MSYCKRMVVQMDGVNSSFNTYELDDKGWNGFACPGFSKDEAIKLSESWSDMMHEVFYDEKLDAFVLTGLLGVIEEVWQGQGFMTEDGWQTLYPIGAWGYCWSWVQYGRIA